MDLFPFTAHELNAFDKMAMIEEDDIDWAEIDNITDPHEIYIRIFNIAEPTKTKQIALRNRYQAIMMRDLLMQWQMQENGALQSAQNVSSAQLTNASIQQNKWVASTQDITN
jgi:hypothetical protein